MKFLPVNSSTIKNVAFDNETLYVEFSSGHFYKYRNVRNSKYLELLNSKSKGKYFAEHIRNKPEYPHERLSSDEISRIKLEGLNDRA